MNTPPTSPLLACSYDAKKDIVSFYQQQRIEFLMGLHYDSYAFVHSYILLMDPLPRVTKAYSLVSQDETQ